MGAAACDLVLLTWNHLECTRPCVESLMENTTLPARLIIVDQASDDGTHAYLKGLQSSRFVAVEIVWNPTNVGYAKGMNIGLNRATAPYVCFLNNDILVPPGWLEELVRVAESDPSIGLVNPASNTFKIHPPHGTDWLPFAKARAEAHGRWIEVKYGEGFCLLTKRPILEKIGGFDETTYEQIYFEDADLGRRFQAAGYRCVMAEGTYVWHEGGQSTSDHPERLRLFEENERRFIRKWGKGKRMLYIAGNPTPDRLERLGKQARAEANRSGDVWITLSDPGSKGKLPRHFNFRVQSYPRWLLPWAALWKVFTKKKKFEGIVCDSGPLRLILKALRGIHRASVEPL